MCKQILYAGVVLGSWAFTGQVQADDSTTLTTKQLQTEIANIEKQAKESKRDAAVVVYVDNVNNAIRRATGASAAGDEKHAAQLLQLGRECVDAAKEALLASEKQEQSDQQLKKTHELKTKLVRQRTLLEETQSRLGFLTSDVQKAEEEMKLAREKAREAEQKRISKKPSDKNRKTPSK